MIAWVRGCKWKTTKWGAIHSGQHADSEDGQASCTPAPAWPDAGHSEESKLPLVKGSSFHARSQFLFTVSQGRLKVKTPHCLVKHCNRNSRKQTKLPRITEPHSRWWWKESSAEVLEYGREKRIGHKILDPWGLQQRDDGRCTCPRARHKHTSVIEQVDAGWLCAQKALLGV